MKIIGLKTKITIKTDKKHHFIFNIYELWPHRYRSAMITATQFTAALLLSQTDLEPSVEVFQQWASYAAGIEPKIHQLVKGWKTRKVKTIDNCRGKSSDRKMGELVIQSPEKIESKIVGTVIKHLIHGISTPSFTHLLWLSGVPFLSFSILPNKKPS